jgi:hypothetical protein
MFIKKEPNVDDVMDFIGQAPHCDSRVLHAPGECQYCDQLPLWQALRVLWGICFTGYEPDLAKKELPCPATVHRPLELINRWGGNIAKK